MIITNLTYGKLPDKNLSELLRIGAEAEIRRKVAENGELGTDFELRNIREVTSQTIEDLAAVAKTFRPCYQYPKGYFTDTILNEKDVSLDMLFRRNEAVGYLLMWHDPGFAGSWMPEQNLDASKVYYGDELALKDEIQKLGIGPILMRYGMVLSYEMGFTHIGALCEVGSNIQGVELTKFYESKGFKVFPAVSRPYRMHPMLLDLKSAAVDPIKTSFLKQGEYEK